MSDLMREEFEEAFKKAFGFGRLLASANPDARQMMRVGLWAWQASRECLVIELPKPYAWDNDGGFEREHDPESECSMALIPKIDAMQAIHAAGVKTK